MSGNLLTSASAASWDLSASRDSADISLGRYKVLAIEIDISTASSLNGTFKLQARVGAGSTWVDVPGSSQTVTSLSAAAAYLFNVSAAGWDEVHLVWTRVSGTGTATAKYRLKE